MKSSAKGDEPKRRRRCLVVDGYNVVAAKEGQGLKGIADLEAARNELIDRLGQYSSFYGEDVAVVFDAYRTSHASTDFVQSRVRVVFTDTGETADHRIERLVYEFRDVYKEVTVATSDYAEQQVAFGGGGLRISSDELLRRLKLAEQAIRRETDNLQRRSNPVMDSVRQDIANILEKWRRQ